MIKQNITLDEVIESLNKVLQMDRSAIQELINVRVDCNDSLASDAEIQFSLCLNRSPQLSVLGLINSFFGEFEGFGAISGKYALKCSSGNDCYFGEDATLSSACPGCGSEIVMGDLVEFVRTPQTEVKEDAWESVKKTSKEDREFIYQSLRVAEEF